MKVGGQIPWNAAAIREIIRIFCLMERHHMKGDSEKHVTDQLSRLEKSCQVFSSFVLYAGGIWKGDIEVADIEELEQMDASELHARRLDAKDVLTPMKGEKFIFPIADGTVKISGGDQVLRTSTLLRDRPDRGEEHEHLPRESVGSSSNPFQYSSLYDGEARNDFWYTESNCTCREKHRSLFHWNTST